MFTQCPQCEAAFRITAEVLQQARGQVRCGSCEHAFNALDHLSEEPPVVHPHPADAPAGDTDVDDNRSQALLKTLDRLAGPDEIRIEDTGVEWLVVDEDDAPAEDTRPQDPDATGSLRWIIEDSESEPAEAELPKVSDQVAAEGDLENADTTEQLVLDEQAAIEFVAHSAEPRYDDNTPLPDDFEEQHSLTPPETLQRRSTDQEQELVESDEAEESQTELELSEPDDWTELLDEVELKPAGGTNPSAEVAAESIGADVGAGTGNLSLEVEEELAAIHDELSTMPDTGSREPIADPLPLADDDLDISLDAELEPAAEPELEVAVVASQLDDLLEAMGTNKFNVSGNGAKDAAKDGDSALSDEMLSLVEDAIDEAAEEISAAAPLEMADEMADETADETADESERTETDDADTIAGAEDAIEDAAERLALDESAEAAGDADSAQPEKPAAGLDGEAIEYEETSGEFERAIADAEGAIRAELAEADDGREPDEIEVSADDDDAASRNLNVSIDGNATTVDEDEAKDLDDEQDVGQNEQGTAKPGHDSVDDLNDELAAMTGNMKIDADLLRAMKDANLAASLTNEDGSPLVETIVMEGDFVSGAIDANSNSGFTPEESAVTRDLQDPGSLVDTYMFSRDDKSRGSPFSGKRAIAGIVILILLLIGQFIHTSRESLATVGAFNQTLGPLYRMFGNPVTPTWDIKGWQFETTNGSTSEDDSVLTIYSRISNRAQQQLPYPLVHVSLTDRYEEIIGSRVLEPSEYLAGNADPSRPVAAGENFTAVITVASPSPEATGFKLNVCYRVTPSRVRCAIEDFKAP